MKKAQAILITVVSAIVLTITGMMSYDYLIAASLLPKPNSMQASVMSIGSRFSNTLSFGAVCGLLPIALYSIWSGTGTKENRKKLLSAVLVLLCMLIALVIRYLMITAAVHKINASPGNITMNAYDINNLNYGLYLFFGMLAGSAIAFILLKRK